MRAESLLQPYRAEGKKPPIFSHGGSTHLAEYLGDDQPIYWLEHHGSSGLAVPATIEQMAANYVEEIRMVQPRGPYYLLGYCIGAVLILEVARRLLAQDEPIGLLCLIDPITPRNLPVRSKESVSSELAGQPRGAATRYLAGLQHIAKQIPRRYRWAKRISKRTLCDLWLRSGYRLPVCLRDFYCNEKLSQALERYAPTEYPGSFVVFRQPDNGTEAGWRSLAAGEVDFNDTWVDHNEFLEEPYVRVIAAKVRERVERDDLEIRDETARKKPTLQPKGPRQPRHNDIATVET